MHHHSSRQRDLLVLLLAADVLYCFLHILHYTTSIAPVRYFALQLDQGYGEFYQYLKELWICLLCFMFFKRKGQPLFATWGLLGGYFLLDDSLRIHEVIGMKLVYHLDLQPAGMLRAQDWGELMVMAFIGLFFLLAFYAAWQVSDESSKRFTKRLLPYLGGLLFFIVVLDMLDVIIPHWGMYLFEDGGEMVAMSFLLWKVWRFRHHSDSSSEPLDEEESL